MSRDKTKIGTTTNVGEVKEEKKRFTNGHKQFTSSEAKALDELLQREKHAKTNFEINANSLIKSRNPVLGEQTPRQELNNSTKIFPLGLVAQQPPSSAKQEILLTAKIGSNDVEAICRHDQPKFALLKSLRNLQDNIESEIEYKMLKLVEKERSLKLSIMKSRRRDS